MGGFLNLRGWLVGLIVELGWRGCMLERNVESKINPYQNDSEKNPYHCT